MLLIATDEAGYGPKLGPLVIAGTAWRVDGCPSRESLASLFSPLKDRQYCGDTAVRVDDSKAIFKPSTGIAGLHAVVSASLHWCEREEATLTSLLRATAVEDSASLSRSPWLTMVEPEPAWLPPSATEDCLTHWKSKGVTLIGLQCRVITAQAFNLACENGCNKADLLSESTLQLVHSLRDAHRNKNEFVEVFCDRHGGRRYYASVLQRQFEDSMVQVIAEGKQESAYQLNEQAGKMIVRFTVKGDSFTPVALSSLHAKYLRERFMENLNRYFAIRSQQMLKPTAGYPVDADRFLADIQPIIERERIPIETLVRSR